MATQVSLTIRRNEAYQRIDKALSKLAKAAGVDYAPADALHHRDPNVELVLRVEQIADGLEALSKDATKATAKATTEVVAEAKKDADAPITVETVEVVPASPSTSTSTPSGKGKAK